MSSLDCATRKRRRAIRWAEHDDNATRPAADSWFGRAPRGGRRPRCRRRSACLFLEASACWRVARNNAGFANGISTHLKYRQSLSGDENVRLTDTDKEEIIREAAVHFGRFLEALGCTWKDDPNSADTPTRVAKAYVNDLWKGRFEPLDSITAFPSDGYSGLVQESNIPITSMCSHHHQTIKGHVSVAYVPAKDGKVVGLSKLNRIVEHFARRGAIQEQLTVAIHSDIDKICENNLGVEVMVDATHN